MAARAAAVTLAAIAGSVPNSTPPAFTLGQEMFSSTASMRSTVWLRRQSSAYSSTVTPKRLAMTAVSTPSRRGALSAMKASMPTFSSPMALSIPAAVSRMRGGAFPGLGSRERPLVHRPPMASTSQRPAYSVP